MLIALATPLALLAAVLQAEATEPMGTPIWVPLGIIALMVIIFAWGLLSRPWATTVAEAPGSHGHAGPEHHEAEAEAELKKPEPEEAAEEAEHH